MLFKNILMFILLTTAGTALADNSIKLKVDLKTQSVENKNPLQQISRRWLEVSALVFHLEQTEPMTVEWTLYGDDLQSGNIVKHSVGSETVNVTEGKKSFLASKEVAFVFTPRHSTKTGSGRSAKFTKIEASGVRYHGWSVRAYIGEKLAGEAFSKPELKKLIEPKS